MSFVVNNAQMRAAEQRCDADEISFEQMMDNAGSACAKEIILLADKRDKIVILCGSGNNGGDGLVISRILSENGFSPTVILVNGEPRSECAGYHFRLLKDGDILCWSGSESKCTNAINEADIVVDCVYGTGFHGTLPENAAAALNAANSCPTRIAVDVPSGVNSDSGEMDEQCFKPTHTFVLAAMKTGLLSPDCNDILGKIKLLDIGIPDRCYGSDFTARLTDSSFRRPFPPRRRSSHKGTFGTLLNIAGCMRYSGAAAMSTKAALRSGVGLCMLATAKTAVMMLAPTINEATYLPLPETEDGFISSDGPDMIKDAVSRATAISVGCGMGNNENTRKITEFVIRNADCPIIIDADGINSVSDNIDILRERKGEVILTPHPLEFSRMSGLSVKDIQQCRIEAAKDFASKYGAVIVLKGANTVIASPNGDIYVNTCGNAGLAKGGSGDTLTGIIGAMAAQGIEPFKAAVSGVYCHALASDILSERLPQESMLAGDIISALCEVYSSSE